jgi:aspartyl-tRNA(Asn)/glutamyl-tRNA(Gln) amidotransferase subunit A
MEITKLTIQELVEALEKGELTSVEIVGAYLAQIKKVDGEINAFLAMNEAALPEAKKSDERRKAGKPLSKIDGIPVAIKDVLLTKGITTTASSKMLENYVPVENATVVQRLIDAGMIVIGKNNCDAWAHGGSTENSDFGPTKNPHDTSRVPGGSSGGSAAAVAASEAPLAIGTDTGGSIRQPAAYCGVVGLKPTYGLNSRYGLIAMASSLDVPGPFTKNVYDNALALTLIAGADSRDATSSGSKPKDYLSGIEKGVKGLKIGLPKEYFSEGIATEVKEAVQAAAAEYKKLGAEIIDISLPMTKFGIATYYVIQPAEVSSNLGRYDGIKYGYAAANAKNLIDHYYKSRTEGLGDEAKRRIMLGTYVLSAGYFDAYYKKAMQVRTLIKKEFDEAFKSVDVILGPTTPTTAFKFGAHASDPLAMYLEDAYTVNANLAGIPALALPCGWVTEDGELIANSQKPIARALPIGMQLMGPQFSEDLLFRVGHAFEKNLTNYE